MKNTGHSFFNGFNGRGTLLDSARVILALVPCYLNLYRNGNRASNEAHGHAYYTGLN